MDEFEIVQMYRQAKHKVRQIRILVELTMMSKEQILDILEAHGEKVNRTRRAKGTKWTPERLALLRSLIEEGVSTEELSERLEVSASALGYACSRFGIHRKRGGKKAKKKATPERVTKQN